MPVHPSPHSFPGSPGHARQRGQSLVEFIVLALVLVPAFMALPLLGKYLDLAHATELAARYLVFESTVAHPELPAPTDAQRAAEVHRRFFGRADAPIRSAGFPGPSDASSNLLWTDHRGHALLPESGAGVHVESELRAPSTPAGAALADRAGFDLPQRNALSARVVVRPRDIAGFVPFDDIGLEIARSQTILSNSWATASSGEARARVENAGFAAYPIAPLKVLGDTIGRTLPPMVLDPAMEVGRVDAEIIPCDRLLPRC